MLRTILPYIFILIVFFLADYFGFVQYLHPNKYIMLVFFGAISYLFHVILKQGMRDKGEKFIQFYLSTVIIRFVASGIFVGIGLYIRVENVKLFIADFFVLYLFFTLFEIFGLYRTLRRF
ncbi:hypothetical protein DJ013_22075 [Arcticibacterium luteifluviistationis]|uniref:Uncharacterized protein n=1 Tax=Arcticibacterium luteifluviistationis TaxID=1784714 RepID=A0A2Z4GI95_9BACT|nr:hypothetical protein DJ013_22075 [Arcticibacterium luteifluviistationis]